MSDLTLLTTSERHVPSEAKTDLADGDACGSHTNEAVNASGAKPSAISHLAATRAPNGTNASGSNTNASTDATSRASGTDDPGLNASSASHRAPTRVVHCTDAIRWLEENSPVSGSSVVTGLPDITGLSGVSVGSPRITVDEYEEWFVNAVKLTLSATDEGGVTIFCQTDIRRNGMWIDKAFLCNRAARALGVPLRWHKIVCRKPPGVDADNRPGYSHLLCYSRQVPARGPKTRYTDVFESPGHMTWSRAFGLDVCRFACEYVASHTSSRTVLDPFCGKGTVLAVANECGLDAIGVEIEEKYAKNARTRLIDELE